MITQINLKSNNVAFFTPYDATFIKRARQLGGTFTEITGMGKAWSFPPDILSDALAAIEDVYGVAPVYKTDELATVRLRFTQGAIGSKEPVVLCGHEIASARGRDSGARLGQGVSIVEGQADSGGSVANWTTTLSKGAVVVIRDFPVKYLGALPSDVEVLESVITRPAAEAAPPEPTEQQIQEAVALLERAGYAVTKKE